MTLSNTVKFCSACGVQIQNRANFCSQCGAKLTSGISPIKSLTPKSSLIILATGGALFLGIWNLQGYLIGNAPTQTHSSQTASTRQGSQSPTIQSGSDRSYMDANIIRLQEVVSKNQDDLPSYRLLSQALWEKLSDDTEPSQTLILDIVDALGNVLRLDANDDQALLMMANLSFNQKVFDKSADFYKKYLALKSDDSEARASYASALTFLHKFDEALKELDTVISKKPDYFQAIAYKAITYAQMGKTAEAISVGQKALALSPTDDARARFAGFLDSLAVGDKEKVPSGNQPAPQVNDTSDPVTQMIKSNSVAGNKYVKTERSKPSIITIFFKEFPMQSMPQSMKDSFIAKIKVAAQKDSTIEKVELKDVDSNEVMISIEITKS